MKNIGIIGYGNIGRGVSSAIIDGVIPNVSLVAVLDKEISDTQRPYLDGNSIKPFTSFDDFIGEDINIVLEAASPSVASSYAKRILSKGIDFIPMSVGGLIQPGFLEELEEEARKTGASLIIPAGAVTGHNIADAGKIGNLSEVRLQTSPRVTSLKEALYVIENNIDIESMEEPQVIFRGNVFDAVRCFPSNVNIAASLALAGNGPSETIVEVSVNPKSTSSEQRVFITGDFGEFECKISLAPTENNAASLLSIYSLLAALKKHVSPIKFGY